VSSPSKIRALFIQSSRVRLRNPLRDAAVYCAVWLKVLVSAMVELNDAIAQLEMRSEQLILHLRSVQRTAPGAEEVRSTLLAMLVRLVALKAQRQHHVELLNRDQAA
jgi:hypothetical protein